MASLQQGIRRDQSGRLLGALLASAGRRTREQLRSRVTLARSARSSANQLSYDAALLKFRTADAVDRPTFYQNYKSAMSSAAQASEAIIEAAIEAGARDQQIVAYVTDDFCSAVNAFMRTSFGSDSQTGHKSRRADELRVLEGNTDIQARGLGHRVHELRARVDEERGGPLQRLGRWLSSTWTG